MNPSLVLASPHDMMTGLHAQIERALVGQLSLSERDFERIDRYEIDNASQEDRELLLTDLTRLLTTSSEVLTGLTDLMIRIIQCPQFSFFRLLHVQPMGGITEGLQMSDPSINMVALNFLDRGTPDTQGVSKIAAVPELVLALVRVWLSSADSGVARKALDVLVSSVVHGSTSGSFDTTFNLMTRRLFRDVSVYRTFFSLCSSDAEERQFGMTPRAKTIAKGRLWDFCIRLDRATSPIRTSQIPLIEEEFGVKEGGLLQFAVLQVDIDSPDELLLTVHIQSCTHLVSNALKVHDPSALDVLSKTGVHTKIIDMYMSSLDGRGRELQIVAEAAQYFGTCCQSEDLLLRDRVFLTKLLKKLGIIFNDATTADWTAHRTRLSTHLAVLAGLSRIANVYSISAYVDVAPPLYYLPCDMKNQDVVNVLAHIFGADEACSPRERSAARVLYLSFLKSHTPFWYATVEAAKSTMRTDVALNVITLMRLLLKAAWLPLPAQPDPEDVVHLPTETQLRDTICDSTNEVLPQEGWEALLTHEPAATLVMGYLQCPSPVAATNASANPLYQVACAKFDLIQDIHAKLSELYTKYRDTDPRFETVRELIGAITLRKASGIPGNHNSGNQTSTLRGNQ